MLGTIGILAGFLPKVNHILTYPIQSGIFGLLVPHTHFLIPGLTQLAFLAFGRAVLSYFNVCGFCARRAQKPQTLK
jgi:hypothetical protein